MNSHVKLLVVAAFTSISSMYAGAADLTDRLVASYKLDGNALNEVSGANAAPGGIVYGATPTVDRCGVQGHAYLFNGVNNYIEFPDSDYFSIPPSGALSISVWVRPDGTSVDSNGRLYFSAKEGSGYVHWMGKGSSGRHEWLFRMYSADNTEGRENRTSSYVFNLSGGLGTGSYVQEPVQSGQWIHYVSVMDNVSQTVRWYKNGVLKDSDYWGPGSSYPVVTGNGTAPFRLGTRDFLSFFAGALDDIKVYNRSLSASEVQEIYSGGLDCGSAYLANPFK